MMLRRYHNDEKVEPETEETQVESETEEAQEPGVEQKKSGKKGR